MRIRTIKPEFWTNEKMAAFPEFTRLLAIGLLNHADDHGYFWANPALIRGALFPFEEDSSKIRRGLEQLSCGTSGAYIRLGKTADGRECGQVINFSKYQRVDRPKDSDIQPFIIFDEQSSNDLRLFDEASPLEGKGKEGKGIPLPAKNPPGVVVQDSRHHEVSQRWGEMYQSVFGISYGFSGKDASTLKRFLTTTKDTADEILEVAKNALLRAKEDRFAKKCKEAATIHGLCTFYNDIRVELARPFDDGGKKSTFST